MPTTPPQQAKPKAESWPVRVRPFDFQTLDAVRAGASRAMTIGVAIYAFSRLSPAARERARQEYGKALARATRRAG